MDRCDLPEHSTSILVNHIHRPHNGPRPRRITVLPNQGRLSAMEEPRGVGRRNIFMGNKGERRYRVADRLC